MKTRKSTKALNRDGSGRRLQRVVSRHRVTFYINPDDPDGTQLVLLGPVDTDNLTIAAGHFGCDKERITTRSRMVTEKYLNSLTEYDG